MQGEKPVIFPILEWLLQKVPELQERAHLAKFLVKIDVPAEIMAEEEMTGIYGQVSDAFLRPIKEVYQSTVSGNAIRFPRFGALPPPIRF